MHQRLGHRPTRSLLARDTAKRPALMYIPCATSPREKIGNIITFTQFEEGNIRTKTCNEAENGDKSNEYPIIPQLLS